MSIDEVWDKLLLPLADVYESGKPNLYVNLGPLFPESFEAVRECVAAKVAEGSLEPSNGLMLYRLTPQGYTKYKARIDFLRQFRTQDSKTNILRFHLCQAESEFDDCLIMISFPSIGAFARFDTSSEH